MTPEDVHRVATDAGRAATLKTLELLGVDVEQPREMQADLLWLRQARVGSDALNRLAKRTAIGIAVSAIAWMLWAGIKSKFWLPG